MDLRSLKFHRVNIKRLSQNAFFGLTSLQYLLIEGEINYFKSSLFISIQTTLTHLILKGNLNLYVNELFTFCQMDNLEHLELDGLQHRQFFQTDSFQKTPNLQHLKIVNSGVSSLAPNAFSLVKRTLKTLNLCSNQFTTLNTSALSILLEANRNIKILLKDNKWLCDCHLKPLTRMLAANTANFDDPVCWHTGERLADVLLPDCWMDDFKWVLLFLWTLFYGFCWLVVLEGMSTYPHGFTSSTLSYFVIALSY